MPRKVVRKSGLNPHDKNALARIVEMLRTWNGEGRNGQEAVVTRADLEQYATRGYLPSGAYVPPGGGGGGGGGIDPSEPIIEQPSLPTNVNVYGGYYSVLVVWGEYNYSGHSHTEIWRSTEDVLGNAVLIGTTPGGMFSDITILPGTTYYYWIRFVNMNGDPGPFNATLGIPVTTEVPAETLLQELTNQITADQLFHDLAARIDLIDMPFTGLVTKVGDLNDMYGDTVSAADSAFAAAASALDAAGDALLASGSATSASSSATSASGFADAASTEASNAAVSAVAADGSAFSAAGSASEASTSAGTAAGHATDANLSKIDAATSATNADGSASSAAGSATQASTSATNAAGSATQAGTSATNAAGSATAADGSSVSAAGHATAANTSATAASGHATNAGASAGSAAASAVSAEGHAVSAAQDFSAIYALSAVRAANKVNPLNLLNNLDGWANLPVGGSHALSTVSGRTEVMLRLYRNASHQFYSDYFDIESDAIYEVTVDYWGDSIGLQYIGLHTAASGSITATTNVRTVSATGVPGAYGNINPYWDSGIRGNSTWRRMRAYLYGPNADITQPVPPRLGAGTHGFQPANGQNRVRLRLLAGYTLSGGTHHNTYWTNVVVRRISDANLAGVTQLNTAIVDSEGNAVATATQQVYSTLGGANAAAVQTKAQAWDNTNAQWSVKASVGSLVGGIGLLNDGVKVRMYVQADRFAVYDTTLPADPTGNLVPFVIESGRVFIKDAVIKNASITSAKIGSVETSTLRVTGSSDANAIADAIIPNLWVDTAKIANTLQSTNFNLNTLGWRILKSGACVFNQVTVRGTVYATAGVFSGKLTGALLEAGAITLDSLRIVASGTGSAVKLSPLIIHDMGVHNQLSGTTTQANRTVTLTGFVSPTNTAAGYHHKRFVRNKMNVWLRVDAMCSGNWDTVHLEYQYDGGSWIEIGQHRWNGYNSVTLPLPVRFTTRSTAWSTINFRARTSEARAWFLALSATIYNIASSSSADNSSTSFTSYTPPPAPPQDPNYVLP